MRPETDYTPTARGWEHVMARRDRMLGSASPPARFDEGRFLSLLGLSPAAADPVRIITAAKVRLRRWRQFDAHGVDADVARERIRLISEARDLLLRRQQHAALEATAWAGIRRERSRG